MVKKKKKIIKKVFKKPVKKAIKKAKKVLIKKKVVKKKPKNLSARLKASKKKAKRIKKPVVKKIPKRKNKKRKLVKKVKAKKAGVKKIRLVKKIRVTTKLARRVKRKRAYASNNENFLPASFFKAKIKVIGIGGGGSSIVSEIGRSLHKATFVVADTDVRAFKKRQGIKYFLFGQKLTHGLGTGVNPELGRQAAESEKERIAHFFDDQDIVIFIASLGGGLGSGATQVFAEAAKNFNGITFGIFTLPFKFEGKNKYKIALRALAGLRKSLNVSITIPNEKIFKIIDANTAITDAFSIVNKNLIESLESLIDLIYNPGIINIDFADLRAILRGRGNLAFLNTAEASGKQRAEDIAKKILHNPLYQTASFTSEKILFNIEGASNLSMFEVDKISKAISERNPKAKIIFGISKNASLKNKIKTTLLMTGGGTAELEDVKLPIAKKVVKKRPAPAKPIVKKAKKIQKPAGKKAALPASVKSQDVPKAKPSFLDAFPVFSPAPSQNQTTELSANNIDIVQVPVKSRLLRPDRESSTLSGQSNRPPLMEPKPKKTIRRSALEIKKAQELEENKQSLQEKEWEIPAFLRIKK